MKKIITVMTLIIASVSLAVSLYTFVRIAKTEKMIAKENYQQAAQILSIQRQMLLEKGIRIDGAVARIGDYEERW